MANKFISTNLERFLERIKSPLTRSKRKIYRALIVTNWLKCQSLNPRNFTKNISQVTYLYKFKIKATKAFDSCKKKNPKVGTIRQGFSANAVHL